MKDLFKDLCEEIEVVDVLDSKADDSADAEALMSGDLLDEIEFDVILG